MAISFPEPTCLLVSDQKTRGLWERDWWRDNFVHVLSAWNFVNPCLIKFEYKWEKLTRKKATIGPLHDPVTWYKITHVETQVARWDFQNKGRSRWTGTSCFFFKSHCATCVPARVILYHVTGSCKGPISHHVKDRDEPNKQAGSSLQDQMLRLQCFLHWWDWQKP